MRYIDADALKQKKVYCSERHENVVPVAEIDWQPTADVVPKSEVEALEREIERLKKSMLPSYYSACSEEEAIKIGKQYGRAEVAREIFEDLDNLAKFIQVPSEFKDGCLMITNSPYLCIKPSDYAELKKKYTGGESNGSSKDM